MLFFHVHPPLLALMSHGSPGKQFLQLQQ